tara:strand:- start:2289 stop:2540 length:252 start_codon:yes stop_codon:yes gene_type:complete
MEQELINWLVGGFGALAGFLIKVMWEAVKDLQSADVELTSKLNSIEVLVAGNYISRDEFDKVISRLFLKLDVIDDKLTRKADR